MKYNIIIYKNPDGYCSYIEGIKNCKTHGDTVNKTIYNTVDTINNIMNTDYNLYLYKLIDNGDNISVTLYLR